MTQASRVESSEIQNLVGSAPLTDTNAQSIVQITKPIRNCAKDIVPKRDWVSMTAVIAICVVALWSIVNVSASIQVTNRQIAYLQQTLLATKTTNASLLAQEQLLIQPGRVLNIASGRLHMRIARPLRITPMNHH